VFYPLYITNLPVTLDARTATDDIILAILMAHNNPIEASAFTRESLLYPKMAKKMMNQN